MQISEHKRKINNYDKKPPVTMHYTIHTIYLHKGIEILYNISTKQALYPYIYFTYI